ncbi:MAG: sugar phosphate isomerase/epimerase [Planctomycetes bacterium]|nr:sugar phosphate isomerase/epimerase [Planctomycetota bacterium]
MARLKGEGNTMSGKISCREGVYGGWEKAAEYLPKTGVHYMEVQFRPLADLQKIAAGSKPFGVSILTLAGGVSLDKPESMAALTDAIANAGKLGVTHMFVSAHGADRAASMAKLREFGEKARAAGTTICLETHPPFCLNAAEMLKTMAEVSHPNVRINFDTANVYYYNKNLNSSAELEIVLPFVASVHLKDTDGGFKSPKFPVLGEGVVDFPRVFRALNSVGFSGPLTLELEGPLVQGLDTEKRHEKVAACVNYLRSVGAA